MLNHVQQKILASMFKFITLFCCQDHCKTKTHLKKNTAPRLLQYLYVSGLYGPPTFTPMWSAWSLVNSVISAPRAGKCNRATFSSRSFGSRYTSFLYPLLSFQFFRMSSCTH